MTTEVRAQKELNELLEDANLEIIDLDQTSEMPATAASSGSSGGHTCSTCGSSSSSCSSCI